MPKLTLYHAAPSRSSIVHWMLEELGEPYDIELVSFKKGENRQPAFLAINPMGKLPALKHGDTVITEAAAICTYLADEFPRAKLNVPIGDPRRGVYLKWLFFGPSCVEPAITERAYPRKEPPARSTLGFGDFDSVVDVLAKARRRGRPLPDGRAVHRRRRHHRLRPALGHDVQAPPRAPGVHRPTSAASTSAPRSSGRRRRTPSWRRSRRGSRGRWVPDIRFPRIPG